VLALISRKQVQGSGFSEQDGGGIGMDEVTRKLVITAWQTRNQDEIEHDISRNAFRSVWFRMSRRSFWLGMCAAASTAIRLSSGGNRIMMVPVSYDVSTRDDAGRRRLRHVARLCEDHGQRIQNSVFECVVDSAQRVVLRASCEKDGY